MRPKLAIVLALLVLLPLGSLALLASRMAEGERERRQQGLRSLVLGQLHDLDETIAALVAQRERRLRARLEATPAEPEALRQLVRTEPAVRAAFALDAEGRRLHPPPDGPRSREEEEFLRRSEALWRERDLLLRPTGEASAAETEPVGAQAGSKIRPAQQAVQPNASPMQQAVQPNASPMQQALQPNAGPPPAAPAQGWYSWHWGSGVELALWQRRTDGSIVGLELDRFRLLADLIAALPAPASDDPASGERQLNLIDSLGQVAYRWGDYQPPPHAEPLASLALREPLRSWRLEATLSPAAAGSSGSGALAFQLLSGLIAVGLVLVALALLFYRESSRELREARQRVSFVNNVSHELKTPLTNIRLYAELLQEELEEAEPNSRHHLAVVVSESQRLSRLIDNVLSFSRHSRGALTLRRTRGSVDAIVERVLHGFGPSLRERGIQVQFAAGAGDEVLLDADALEQILANLLGNAEKYAPDGALRVETRLLDGLTRITVADSGPGIPVAERQRVFMPFVRLSDSTRDGVAGTGIGLAIARELARLHGGELQLLDSPAGACFELTLRTPAA